MLQENKVSFAQKMALGAFVLLSGVVAAAVVGFIIDVPVGPYTFYIAVTAILIYCLWRDRRPWCGAAFEYCYSGLVGAFGMGDF